MPKTVFCHLQFFEHVCARACVCVCVYVVCVCVCVCLCGVCMCVCVYMLCQELDEVFMGWGSLRHHSPVLLAWTMLRFVTQPDGDVEVSDTPPHWLR